jgi:hypothetical protein
MEISNGESQRHVNLHHMQGAPRCWESAEQEAAAAAGFGPPHRPPARGRRISGIVSWRGRHGGLKAREGKRGGRGEEEKREESKAARICGGDSGGWENKSRCLAKTGAFGAGEEADAANRFPMVADQNEKINRPGPRGSRSTRPPGSEQATTAELINGSSQAHGSGARRCESVFSAPSPSYRLLAMPLQFQITLACETLLAIQFALRRELAIGCRQTQHTRRRCHGTSRRHPELDRSRPLLHRQFDSKRKVRRR